MRTVLCVFLPLMLICGTGHARAKTVDTQADIAAFNRVFADATRAMDNAATLALWEDDGISLLSSTEPIAGKKAIAKFMDAIRQQYPGAHMQTFDSQCFDILVSGDLATEWCTEHQIVNLDNGKPPFDSRGKMLLVLHRGTDGHRRLRQEMWNQAVAPDAGTRASR